MGGRNDNSQDCQCRQQRPLSIIQENSDEEGGNFDVVLQTVQDVRSGPSSTGTVPRDRQTADPHNPPAKKTRKKAVAPQQHPVFSLGLLSSAGERVSANVAGCPDVPNSDDSDGSMLRLKDTATKLKLKTRRPSYLAWRAKYLDKLDDMKEVNAAPCADDRLTPERKEKMNNAIRWIRNELVDLRRQDQSLAKQLLAIRHELSRLRLSANCEAHQDLLDDAQDQVEVVKELSRFIDFTPDIRGANHLKHIGVTKINLTSRRFSTC